MIKRGYSKMNRQERRPFDPDMQERDRYYDRDGNINEVVRDDKKLSRETIPFSQRSCMNCEKNDVCVALIDAIAIKKSFDSKNADITTKLPMVPEALAVTCKAYEKAIEDDDFTCSCDCDCNAESDRAGEQCKNCDDGVHVELAKK
jgi:hypothetical protein